MAKKGYLVFLGNTFHGILEDKDEYKEFISQRNPEHYNFVKKKWDDIYTMLAEHGSDVGQYSSIRTLDGTILFAHEEFDLIEYASMAVGEAAEDIPYLIKEFKEYVKFNDCEKQTLNEFTVFFSKIFHDEYENGIFFDRPRDGMVDLDKIKNDWMVLLHSDTDVD